MTDKVKVRTLRPYEKVKLQRLKKQQRNAVNSRHARIVLLSVGKNTLRRRLEEARDALGSRLSGRGIVWSAALSAVLLSDCVAWAAPAPGLVVSTVEAAAGVAAGKTVATAASAKVAALTEGVLQAMFMTKFKIATFVFLTLALLVTGIGMLALPAVAEQAMAAWVSRVSCRKPHRSHKAGLSRSRRSPGACFSWRFPSTRLERYSRVLCAGEEMAHRVGPILRDAPGPRSDEPQITSIDQD
jgi:hypothetical protein